MLCPDKTGIFGNGSLSGEAAYIANLCDDASGIDFADARDGYKCVGDDFKLLLNGFLQRPDLAFQSPHGRNGGRHDLIDRIVHGFGQTIGAPGGCLNKLSGSLRVSKSAMPSPVYKGCQFVQISVGQLVHRFKVLHESKCGGAGVGDVLALCDTRAFQKQIVCKPFLFPREVLNGVESGSGKGLKGFVAVIVHVDLLADTSKAKLVSNHKGVHRVVLGQLRIGFLKIFDLFGIEYMDFPMEPAQIAILTECVY